MIRKRIAIIVPTLGVGGAENMVVQLAAHIDTTKFQALLIVLGEKEQTPIQSYIDNFNVDIIYLNKGIGINYKMIIKLYKLLSDFRPDLVHTHLHSFAYAFPWIISHNVKMLHTVHSDPEFESSKKGKILISILYRLNKAIPVAISRIIEEKMNGFYKYHDIETIYNPVNIERFHFNRKYMTDKCPIFINIGRLAEAKNQILLLESFALTLKYIPQAKLKIVGDGILKSDLESLSIKLNINHAVEFLGIIKETEVQLANADIFVLSSNYEGLPLTVLEAMAASLPIISTNVGGVPDIVTNNGILVEPNSVKQLAQAMVDLASDQEKRKDMGEKSYQNVQTYDVVKITREYETLYLKYS